MDALSLHRLHFAFTITYRQRRRVNVFCRSPGTCSLPPLSRRSGPYGRKARTQTVYCVRENRPKTTDHSVRRQDVGFYAALQRGIYRLGRYMRM